MSDELVDRLRAAGCVFAEEEASLLRSEARTPEHLERLLTRRLAGEPLEHVLGWVELDGLRLAVGPGVFVPRQRSRVLVAAALSCIPGVAGPVVVELCCGAGAIAALIQRARPDAQVWASDIDPIAVATARRNLPPERVVAGDLDGGLPTVLRGKVDVVVANAPYVPSADIGLMPVEAREHEPLHALDGGADGLDLHRRIAEIAPRWLAAAGAVVLETSRRQTPAAAAVLVERGFAPAVVRDDDVDGTAVVGTRV